jgi:hypothetical protein
MVVATGDDQRHREAQKQSSAEHPVAAADPPGMERSIGTDVAGCISREQHVAGRSVR